MVGDMGNRTVEEIVPLVSTQMVTLDLVLVGMGSWVTDVAERVVVTEVVHRVVAVPNVTKEAEVDCRKLTESVRVLDAEEVSVLLPPLDVVMVSEIRELDDFDAETSTVWVFDELPVNVVIERDFVISEGVGTLVRDVSVKKVALGVKSKVRLSDCIPERDALTVASVEKENVKVGVGFVTWEGVRTPVMENVRVEEL